MKNPSEDSGQRHSGGGGERERGREGKGKGMQTQNDFCLFDPKKFQLCFFSLLQTPLKSNES